MWVVFWMTYAEVDTFEIFEDQERAKARYEFIFEHDNPSCAGYAPIKDATEPHWYD
jgi:hypothetical protein